MTMTGALQAIWEQNRGDILAQVDEIEGAIADALAGELTDGARESAARQAHKLVGSVGTFGFAEASEHARSLETALGEPGEPEPSDLQRLADLVVALRRTLEYQAPPRAEEPAERGPAERLPLLVVAENTGRAQWLVAEAEERGLGARLAQGLDSARRLIEYEDPEAVLLHLSVAPDGEEVLGFLGEVSGSRAVLVVTAPDQYVDRVEVARRGGRGFLSHELPPDVVIDAAAALRERLRTRGTRILAVDDDPSLLSALDVVLSEAGLEPSTCQEPERLWERLEEIAPDLVILDFDMPGVTGPDLCRAMRNDQRWEAIPVLFLTSRRDPDSIRAVFAAGADDYVPKPFVGPELVARVSHRLERVRLYRAMAQVDDLTGVPNRRHGQELLEAALQMAGRVRQPLSLGILDVDRFKRLNLDSGHRAGDAVLRGVGVELRRFFGEEATLARWGGDAFVIGLPGMRGSDGRQRLGDFVEHVRERRFGPGSGVSVTVSAGLAEYPGDGDHVDALYGAADRALHAAKDEGRDRVVSADRLRGTGAATVDVAIVEDDTLLGQLLEDALQTRGYRTRWLADGEVAAEALAGVSRELSAPLVLLDWDLPGLDGLRLLGRMRERKILEDTRVIMLTARASEAEVLEALETGAVDHVSKPFSVPVLMQRVRRAMERG
jgi:diguanylate cyclase (GGDEF)-like protein